jgi:UDP-N-acetylmuramate dehydrogenase
LYITDFLARSNGVTATTQSLPHGIQRDVCLAPYTTLGVGGPAAFFAYAQDTPHLMALVAWAQTHRLPMTLLGGGSNVVVNDLGIAGLVVMLTAQSHMPIPQQDGTSCLLTYGGGDAWCTAVDHAVALNLYGIECLAGIPGRMGAAPVQNIGAYGQDIAQTLAHVKALDTASGQCVTLPAADLGLGYRTSYFKTKWPNRYVITAVTLRLQYAPRSPPHYPDLVSELARQNIQPQSASAQAIAAAVIARRDTKGMVWRSSVESFQSVGSFFVNPQVPQEVAMALRARWPDMPQWPTHDADPKHAVKLSAAWLIEAADMHPGWLCEAVDGRVGLSPRHALALINTGGATAQDILRAATCIYDRVLACTQVALTAEARCLGFKNLAPPMVST